MAKFEITLPDGTVRTVEGETFEDAQRQIRGGGGLVPPPGAPPLERPPPQDPIGARAPTNVEVDEQGRVKTQPFLEAETRKALPLGPEGEFYRHLISRYTGLPLGGETQFDPLVAGLNVLTLGRGRALAPVVRGALPTVQQAVKPFVETVPRRIATGAGLEGTYEAAKAAVEGKPISEVATTGVGGAARGAAKTAAGEVVGGVLSGVLRAGQAGTVREQVRDAVYTTIENSAPWVASRKGIHVPIKTDADIWRIFIKGEGRTNLSDMYQRHINELLVKTGNPQITSTVMVNRKGLATGASVDLKSALQEVQDLGRIAWKRGLPTEQKLVLQAQHRQLQDEIGNALSNHPQHDTVVPFYQDMRRRYAEGKAFLDFMQKIPKVGAGGKISIQAIRDATENAKQVIDLARNHPEGLEELVVALNRGAGPMAGKDVPGIWPALSTTPPFVRPPQLPVVPGWTPYGGPAGRAGIDVAVASGAAPTGLSELIRLIFSKASENPNRPTP
jgi:hypothetical protein